MGRALLVGGENMAHLPAIVVKLVVDIEDGAAGVAEYGIDALLQQTFHQDLRACHLHRDFLL